MTDRLTLNIAGVGLMTAVGDAAITAAATRAGISRYQASGFYNSRDKAMVTTSVPEDALPPLNEELHWIGLNGREKRMIRLADPALKQVMAAYPEKAPIPLFLAGPEPMPGNAKVVSAKMLKYLSIQTEINFDLSSSRYFASGRAGVLEAIALAFNYLEVSQSQFVLVGGVDSLLDVATLSYLDAEGRVLAEGVSDGAAPGEGAGFLLLTSHKSSPGNGGDNIVLHKPGLGSENGHLFSDEPYQGQGLADAVKNAVAQVGESEIGEIYSSMNGESFFAKEFGVVMMRNSKLFSENAKHYHPAEYYGDIGAASGACLIALAQNSLSAKDKASKVLVYCSSDGANRAAICIEKGSKS